MKKKTFDAQQQAPWDNMLARQAVVGDKDSEIVQAIDIVKKHGQALGQSAATQDAHRLSTGSASDGTNCRRWALLAARDKVVKRGRY